MTRVLLTGGSGFIAAHCLDQLLKRGHSVVTTVRSNQKAQRIKDAYPDVSQDRLDFAVVEDIAQPDAFDKAVISDPPFEAVIHTASPFHFNATDIKKDLLDPAIIGTTGILKAIKKSAPSVKRVVVTSSFAAIVNGKQGLWPDHTYTEADWNPITEEQALQNAPNGYRAGKTFAEKAAWDFVEKEKPNFTLATCCPPLVLGPVIHYLASLDTLNTSNQRVGDLMQGKQRDALSPSGVYLWIDVRDLALAHVLAAERADAADKRFFLTAGYFSMKEVAEIVRDHFPDLADRVPKDAKGLEPGARPAEVYGFDNSRAREILGLKFTSLTDCIVDTVKSLKAVGG